MEEFSLDDRSPLFQVSASDSDLGENGRISYSVLPPYGHFFRIDDEGQIFPSTFLNQSSFYHLRISPMDHGEPVRLNSTYDCYITLPPSISTSNDLQLNIDHQQNLSISNSALTAAKKIFQWSLTLFDRYSMVVIVLLILFLFIILTLISVCLTFCFHAILFTRRKTMKNQQTYHYTKQYHLYDSVPRKSPFIHDDSGCSSKLDDQDDLTSEERERLVQSTSDQTSCQSSDSMNRQIRMINQVCLLTDKR